MSENHTYVPSSEIIARQDEINRLKSGDTPEKRRAEQLAAQRLSQMNNSIEQLRRQMSQQRRDLLQSTHRAMEAMNDSARTAAGNADIVQRNANAVRQAIDRAASSLDNMVENARAHAANAAELYVHLVQQYAATENRTEYRRFAAADMASIKTRLNNMAANEVSSAAMQMMITSVLADIYRMDLSVARQQAAFDSNMARATELATKIIAQLNSARSNNHAVVGDPSSELLDIDFWSGNRFGDLLGEVTEINDRLTLGLGDPGYSADSLAADLARLAELDKAKDIIIADARKTYNQSVMRENQAFAAMEILRDEHDFSIVGHGFEGNDRREAYIIRMRRHTDNAEIEIIVSPTAVDNEFSMYFRLDTRSYADQNVMEAITTSLAADFRAAGLRIDVNRHCVAETLQPFNAARPVIPEAARRMHNIPAPR